MTFTKDASQAKEIGVTRGKHAHLVTHDHGDGHQHLSGYQVEDHEHRLRVEKKTAHGSNDIPTHAQRSVRMRSRCRVPTSCV